MSFTKSFAPLFIALSLVACSTGGDSSAPATTTAVVVQPVDSLNATPLLSDADGRMDSLFRAKGYVFGDAILDAARDGNPDAQFLLAQMYSYGIAGATPVRRKAFKLYVALADNGLNDAKAMAGYMYLYGYGVDQDVTKGLDMVTEAANNGNGLAYLFMGNFYRQADPSPKNIALAKTCYYEAQKLGVAEAAEILKSIEK